MSPKGSIGNLIFAKVGVRPVNFSRFFVGTRDASDTMSSTFGGPKKSLCLLLDKDPYSG